MIRFLSTTFFVLSALILSAGAQVGRNHPSLEFFVSSSDLVVRGYLAKVDNRRKKGEQNEWIDLTLKVSSTLKGTERKEVTFSMHHTELWQKMRDAKQDQLWFLGPAKVGQKGEQNEELKGRPLHALEPIFYGHFIRLSDPVPDQGNLGLPGVLRTNLSYLDQPKDIIAATQAIVATEPGKRSPKALMKIPYHVARQTEMVADFNSLWIPLDHRLEDVLRKLIQHPEQAIPAMPGDLSDQVKKWWPLRVPHAKYSLQAEAAKFLEPFRSERNILLLKSLLSHTASESAYGLEEVHYPVRQAAAEVLRGWKVDIGSPVLIEGRDARKPHNDEDLRYWLQNMIWYHNYSWPEVTAATDLTTKEIKAAINRFKIRGVNRPKERASGDSPLLVLPYPGGRHPRIGFLDGAIKPQRETKVSIFTPWNPMADYVVADIPEALWSNLGLTYLAHTHVPTIWTKQKIELEKREWERKPNGTLEMRRKLPNGIEFGTTVKPGRDAVRMEMWLKNGTPKTLTDLRVQNCIMLKQAGGFTAQNNDNKVFQKPYVAVRHENGDKWIITAWAPCDRPWANAKCPCLHSDPRFPDCPPGETKTLKGWLSFYQGTDLKAELARIDATGWQN